MKLHPPRQSHLKSATEVAANKAFKKAHRKMQREAIPRTAKNPANHQARLQNPDIRKIIAGQPAEMWSEGLNAKQRKEGWMFGVPTGGSENLGAAPEAVATVVDTVAA